MVLKVLQGQKDQAVLLLQKDTDGRVEEADATRKRGCPLASGFRLRPGDSRVRLDKWLT